MALEKRKRPESEPHIPTIIEKIVETVSHGVYRLIWKPFVESPIKTLS